MVLDIHEEAIYCCDLYADFLCTGGGDKALFFLLGKETYKVIGLAGHKDSIVTITFYPNSHSAPKQQQKPTLIATGSMDGNIRIFSIQQILT